MGEGLSTGATSMRIAAVMAVLSGLTACTSDLPRSSYTEDTYSITPGHSRDRVIGTGSVGDNRWRMRASVDANGQLCLGVDWQPTSPDNRESGCGFGPFNIEDEGRGTAPTDTTTSGDGGVTLVYGPAPIGATTVRLTIGVVSGTERTAHPQALCPTQPSSLQLGTAPITRKLPAWYAIHGGWFAVPVSPSAASCAIDAAFFDSTGHRVRSPQNF